MIKQERTTSRESLVLSMQQQQQQQWVSFSLLTSLLASFSQILSHCNVRASREKSSSGATRKVFASVATTTTTFICSIWLALLCLVVVVVVVVVVNEEKICGKSSVIPLSMSRTHMRSKVETFNKNSLSLFLFCHALLCRQKAADDWIAKRQSHAAAVTTHEAKGWSDKFAKHFRATMRMFCRLQ